MAVAQKALTAAANEGRNVLPDATDDQAAVIEAWAAAALVDHDWRSHSSHPHHHEGNDDEPVWDHDARSTT